VRLSRQTAAAAHGQRSAAVQVSNRAEAAGGSIFQIGLTTLDGKPTTLEQWRGRVLLIVNVASGCGFTPQYAGLEALYRKHAAHGLVVLGFPCNQFANQEPGTEQEIAEFCSARYDVTFPMFAKVEVNGPNTHPLYRYLKSRARGMLGSESIKWNFTKFVVDRTGKVVARYAPTTRPERLEPELKAWLAAQQPGSGKTHADSD
jgi:glutathione peroxidase